MPSPYLAREVLETCSSINEAERLLRAVDRTDSMAFYVVEGRTEHFALFECTQSTVARRDPVTGSLVASCSRDRSVRTLTARASTLAVVGTNLRRRMDRIHALWTRVEPQAMPVDLASMLADPGIEDVSIEGATLYANVACPGESRMWFASGAVPAASCAEWRPVPWPW
jgi:hypothetical protein